MTEQETIVRKVVRQEWWRSGGRSTLREIEFVRKAARHDATLLYFVPLMYRSRGEHLAALRSWKLYLKRRPRGNSMGLAQVRHHMAEALAKLGRSAEARREFLHAARGFRAAALASSSPLLRAAARYEEVWCRAEAGDILKARELIGLLKRSSVGRPFAEQLKTMVAHVSGLFETSNSLGADPHHAVNATVLAPRRLQSKRRATRPARYRAR